MNVAPPLLPISANIADTGWIDISWLTKDATFMITGTWSGVIAFDVSDEPYVQGATRTNYGTITTYSANPTTPLFIPRAIGQVIRFRRVSWVSGTANIGFGTGVDSEGKVQPIVPESSKQGNAA